MRWGGREQTSAVLNDQSRISRGKHSHSPFPSASPRLAPPLAHRRPEPTWLDTEKVFYCNLSPFKCKPYNPLATCSGFGSLLKTSSILSYKTQPYAETLQASHLLTISLLRIWILRHFYKNGGPLPLSKHHQKYCQVLPVGVVFDETDFEHPHLHVIFPQDHWK